MARVEPRGRCGKELSPRQPLKARGAVSWREISPVGCRRRLAATALTLLLLQRTKTIAKGMYTPPLTISPNRQAVQNPTPSILLSPTPNSTTSHTEIAA